MNAFWSVDIQLWTSKNYTAVTHTEMGTGTTYVTTTALCSEANQRTIGPENAHLKPDPGVLSHHEMTLTLNTHTPLLNS